MADGLNMSRRIRRTPYTDRVEALGVRGFSVVNHMLLPKSVVQRNKIGAQLSTHTINTTCYSEIRVTLFTFQTY